MAAAAAGVVLVAGCAAAPTGQATNASGGGLSGTTIGNPFQAPAAELVDTEGEPYSLAAQTDRPLTLLFFGYTHCPDICQIVMSNIASALTRLDDAARDQVDVVFVTTDPARDDATVLRSYLDRFDPSFVGLTGDLRTIVEAGEEIGVLIDKGDRLPSGGFDIAHTDRVFAIDGDDEIPVLWGKETSAAQFAADITTILEDSP
ncbi:SCO family protein [Nocardioides sp. MJB4]|uniref:SCO family protein n=1 Tax=Nocardioides donggukensis TaxID=2774019 RepID=A0A927K5V7_9ACTN|nr:SCO family protein [Nocardioides donggukensis]